MVIPVSERAVTDTFLFGKLPAHGDFVWRGMAAAERDELDLWLSSEMAEARRHHGERFDVSFDEAPPWRFAWDEGIAWTAGALAPSVDAVGRRFPIMVARRTLDPPRATAVAALCEACIYEALAEGLDADGLSARLTRVESDEGEEPEAECWWTLGSGLYPEARLRGRTPPRLLVTALTRIEETL